MYLNSIINVGIISQPKKITNGCSFWLSPEKDFDKIVVFCHNKTAENVLRYCDKGQEVIVSGALKDMKIGDKKIFVIDAYTVSYGAKYKFNNESVYTPITIKEESDGVE